MFGGGGRRRVLSKDYTLLRDDQDPDDIESGQNKNGASAWRLVGLAKEEAFVSIKDPTVFRRNKTALHCQPSVRYLRLGSLKE